MPITIKIGQRVFESRYAQTKNVSIYDSRGDYIRGDIPIKDVILNPDIKLTSFVKNEIDKICINDYGPQCILIIFVGDPVWSD